MSCIVINKNLRLILSKIFYTYIHQLILFYFKFSTEIQDRPYLILTPELDLEGPSPNFLALLFCLLILLLFQIPLLQHVLTFHLLVYLLHLVYLCLYLSCIVLMLLLLFLHLLHLLLIFLLFVVLFHALHCISFVFHVFCLFRVLLFPLNRLVRLHTLLHDLLCFWLHDLLSVLMIFLNVKNLLYLRLVLLLISYYFHSFKSFYI